ncbi:MAG TPA: glyoxalase/bleomycin resistance/dioxygenase family protein, partial [Streptosporangiaceae bacterium]|nr:glyoxalase/bleomycin resistance/dioxygenase family protein [Streptosporangiaceae bacterium]
MNKPRGKGRTDTGGGYANFAVTEPPLKLVLLENPGQGGTLNHLGVEVDDAGAVDAEQARLA